MSRLKPDLFIVGAPKCGTTSLASYLGEHPEVYFPQSKEPLFFCSEQEHREKWQVKTLGEYLDLFSKANGFKRIGEASVWYLYSAGAAARIKEFNPEGRIIILLRNPVDQVCSLHSQFLYSGNENIRSFAQAYALQKERALGNSIPPGAHFPSGLLYTEVARYASQVERYLQTFNRDMIKVLIFEEFFANIENNYKELLKYLEVNPAFRPDFFRMNSRKIVRSVSLQRLCIKGDVLWKLGYLFPSGFVRDGLQWRMNQFRDKIIQLNTMKSLSYEIPIDLRRKLHCDFADDIARLSDLIGTDLSIWTRMNLLDD